MPRLQASRKTIGVCIAIAVVATIALVPQARSQVNPTAIEQIISQLTGDVSAPGLNTSTGVVTGATTTGGATTGTGATTSAPSDRGPQIITNQFTTVQGGSIGARRPGLWTQQAIAFRATGEPALSGNVPVKKGFFTETLLLMFQGLIDSINGFLDTLNLGVALGGLGGGGTGGGITPISNPATTGQGTSTPIP